MRKFLALLMLFVVPNMAHAGAMLDSVVHDKTLPVDIQYSFDPLNTGTPSIITNSVLAGDWLVTSSDLGYLVGKQAYCVNLSYAMNATNSYEVDYPLTNLGTMTAPSSFFPFANDSLAAQKIAFLLGTSQPPLTASAGAQAAFQVELWSLIDKNFHLLSVGGTSADQVDFNTELANLHNALTFFDPSINYGQRYLSPLVHPPSDKGRMYQPLVVKTRSFGVPSVPEPSSLILGWTGLLTLGLLGLKKRQTCC